MGHDKETFLDLDHNNQNDGKLSAVQSAQSIEKLQSLGLFLKISNEQLKEIQNLFDVKVSPIFLEKILNKQDEISKQFIPSVDELNFAPEELQDPIGDERWSPVEGITHRYVDRVLLKPTYLCAVYCRFCFRRYKVSDAKNNLKPQGLQKALDYIAQDNRIREVILTGGDPLILSDSRLAVIAQALCQIPHVKILRIHSRIPTAQPERVTDNLISTLKLSKKTIWFVSHINSAAELTPESQQSIARLIDQGIPVLNQAVLLKGVNDNLNALCELFQKLTEIRVQPYYLHYPDLAKGTEHFRIPLAEAIKLVGELRGKLPGYGIPHLTLDIPGGEGKITLTPANARLITNSPQETWEFQSPLSGQVVRVSYPHVSADMKSENKLKD